MTKFLVLPALKSVVTGIVDDLATIRKQGVELTKKTAALNAKGVYNVNYVTTEVSKLRENAMTAASDFLDKKETYQHIVLAKQQSEFWTPLKFLYRSLTIPEPTLTAFDSEGQVKLLKALLQHAKLNNLLLSASLLTTADLATMLDAALSVEDWLTAGSIASVIRGRSARDDAAAMSLKLLESLDVAPVDEARTLIDETKRLEEFLGYALRVISDGGEDVGLRFEGYQKMAADKEKAQMAAHTEQALAKLRATVDARLGQVRPAA